MVEGIGDNEDEVFGMKGTKVGLGLLKGHRYWIMERIDDERDKIRKRRLFPGDSKTSALMPN